MNRLKANRFLFKTRSSTEKKRGKEKGLLESVDAEVVSFISRNDAVQIQRELSEVYDFSEDQLIETTGLACACAITKSYPRESLTKEKGALLVVCGPGANGAIGLVCARYLKSFEYKPTLFYRKKLPTSALYTSLAAQSERIHIPFLSYMPSEPQLLTCSYNLIVDALFGSNFVSPPADDFVNILQTIQRSEVPIVSIDLPSGWEADKEKNDGIQPDVLISLTAPKLSARSFHGRAHYLVGRFLPPDIMKKYDLQLPIYPGTELCVELAAIEHIRPQLSSDSSVDLHE